MKVVLFFISAVISVQFCVGFFHNVKYFDKESKYFKKEPPLKLVKKLNDPDNVYEAWIKQRLDHFDPQNVETFMMRYLINKDNYKPGGPIFIFVGGEWTVSGATLQYGHMYDMAKALNGLMFYTEHRYYGKTRPTKGLTLEELRFLNIDQALADLAHFITFAKENFAGAKTAAVILVGCSYSGTMVTWFRKKYPHLVNGVWSTSAPLEAKVDFIEYKEVVSKVVHEVGGEKCSGRIRKAFEHYDSLVKDKKADELTKLFKLCSKLDINNELDIWNLLSSAAGPWSVFVQYYSREDRDIENSCEELAEIQAETDAEAYAKWILGRKLVKECYDHDFGPLIKYYEQTTWDSSIAKYGERQWTYQTCAEYGWYHSSGSENIIFGSNFPVNLSLALCKEAYDNFFTPDIVYQNAERTNTIYGARSPDVRFVYSTHGEYDPWAPIGVNKDINEDSPVVILPGGSHCSDMNSISVSDTPEMKASKQRLFQLVQKWIGIPEENRITLPDN